VVHSLLAGLGHSRHRGGLLSRGELLRLEDLRNVSLNLSSIAVLLPIPGGAMPGMPGGVPAKPGGRL
jgi:hypothetical protein